MPPKIQVTKEKIIQASIDIVRKSGINSLNARAIAKELKCSTQPIFSNYSSMEELKKDVINSAKSLYNQYIKEGFNDPNYPKYKSSGISYIKFAKEEKELFKLLFMRDRSNEKIEDEKESLEKIISIISSNLNISYDDAFNFHIKMWLYAHGIATTIATSYLDWDWDTIDKMLTEAYVAMKHTYQK